MILYHLTPRDNVGSITDHGLLTAFARDDTRRIWLCAGSRVQWAAEHVARRHGVPQEDLAMLRVVIRWESARRHSRCLWYCQHDIPITSIHLCQVSSQSTPRPCVAK
jgi:hypothetical protein